MAVVLSALRTELLTDPASLGYASYVSAGSFSILTGMLASVSANAGTATSTIDVGTVYAAAMQICVVASEYGTLTGAQRDLWNAALTAAVNGIAISNTVFRGQITTVWSAGLSGTRNNLLALQSRPCSRVETLFGEGTRVDVNEVARAVYGDF